MLARAGGRRGLAVVAGVATVALVALAVWWFGIREAAASDEGMPEVTTTTTAAALSTVEKAVGASGTLTPGIQEEAAFLGSGTVTAVEVAVGDEVTEGQTLATIDTLQLEAEVLAARADLATAEAELVSAEGAEDGTSVAEAQTAAAAARVEVAAAAVETAEEAMAGATLAAPAAGRVVEVGVEVGDAVVGSSASTGSGSGTAVGGTGAEATATATTGAQFLVVGAEQWQVDVTVGDADVALLTVGDQVEITLESSEDLAFGTVAEVGLVPTSSTGVPAYPVTVAVTGSPEGLYDGVGAEVEIVYERRTDVLTIPSAAVRTVDGESVVTRVDADGTEVETVVTVGETTGESVEVLDGLAEGDEVQVTVVQVTRTQGEEQEGFVPGELPEGFVPGELPEGFTPGQMPGGAGGFGGQDG